MFWSKKKPPSVKNAIEFYYIYLKNQKLKLNHNSNIISSYPIIKLLWNFDLNKLTQPKVIKINSM